jgi:Sugar-transfer associated ATP-grasp
MAASSSSDAGGATQGPLLKNRSIGPRFDLAASLRWVRQAHGVGLLRQVGQALALSRRAGMTPREYYELALFRPALTEADRRAYVSFRSQRALNLRLSPAGLRGLHGLCTDKVLCALVLAQAGLATVPTLALFSTAMVVPAIPALATPEALADWLLHEAPLPVFGKPVDGSLGMGGASILDREGDELLLGDGRRVAARALAAEVARDYGGGWQVQPLLRLHPDVAALAGTAVAMLRVVTLRDAMGTAALYALLRLPAQGAMIDANQPHAPNGNVVVDPATGALGRAQSNWHLNTTALDTAPATGLPLAGRHLPSLPQACRLCETAHRLFPRHGVLGFDVALTPEGPVIGEVNSLPHHHNWQRAADRGLMNSDFAPRFAAAIAETERRTAREAAEAARVTSGRH